MSKEHYQCLVTNLLAPILHLENTDYIYHQFLQQTENLIKICDQFKTEKIKSQPMLY